MEQAEDIVNGYNYIVETDNVDELRKLVLKVGDLLNAHRPEEGTEPEDFPEEYNALVNHYFEFVNENEFAPDIAILLTKCLLQNKDVWLYTPALASFDQFHHTYGKYIIALGDKHV